MTDLAPQDPWANIVCPACHRDQEKPRKPGFYVCRVKACRAFFWLPPMVR